MKHKSVWVLWFFIGIFAAMIGVQFAVDFELPIGSLSYGMMLVIGAYTGIDQLAAYRKTKTMEPGTKYTGNREKLMAILIGLCIITIEAIVCQAFLDYELPLDEIVMCTALIGSLYVGGNKAITAVEMDGPK